MKPDRQVKISFLLHNSLVLFEKKLKSLILLNQHKNKRILFFQKLIEIRIAIGRLLALYRWSLSNSHIDLKNENKKYDVKSDFIQLINFFRDHRLTPYNTIISTKSLTINNQNLQTSKFLFLLSNSDTSKGHVTKIINNKKMYMVVSEYHYAYLVRKKNQQYCLKELYISDRNKIISPEFAKKLAFVLTNLLRNNPNFVSIDKLLFSVHLSIKFVEIIMTIRPYLNSYSCDLEIINNQAIIVFPETFLPFNKFIIEKTPKRIQLRSVAPLHIPPEDCSNIHESYNKFMPFDMPEKLGQMFDLSLDSNNIKGEILIGNLHKILFYTKVRNFLFNLKSNIRSSLFPHFNLSLKCVSESIYFIHIILYDRNFIFLKILFNLKTGEPDYSFNLGNQIPPKADLDLMLWSVFNFSTEFSDFSTLFRNHFLILNRFYLSFAQKKIYNFSFSSNFYIEKEDGPNGPAIHHRSYTWKGDSFNPNTVILDSLRKKIMNVNFKMEHIFDDLMLTTKLFSILMELELKLSNDGYFCRRNMNSLWVPSINCMFKITTSEYWLLVFKKIDFPFIKAGVLRIEGKCISLRFVDSIYCLIKKIILINSLGFFTRREALFSSECLIIRKIYNRKIIIELTNLFDSFQNNGFNIFYTTLFSIPTIESNLVRSVPLFKLYENDPYNDNDGLIKTALVPSIKICDYFNDDDWQIVPYPNYLNFFLIYKNKFTLNVQRLTAIKYSIQISVIGTSGLLVIPVLKVINEYRNTKFNTIFARIIFTKFPKIKESIESYSEIINSFEYMKINIFKFNNKRIEAKATKFFLSNIIVDENGMIISSISFPAVEYITKKIQSLENVEFKLKNKLSFFIVKIMSLPDAGVLKLFDLLKIIFDYPNFSWQKMIDKWVINSETRKFTIVLIEYEKELILVFDDPIARTANVEYNGFSKRITFQLFDKLLTTISISQSLIDQIISLLNSQY